jgi:hypothetical protein
MLMRVVFCVALSIPTAAQASLEALVGNYKVTDLGCATPPANRYQLEVMLSISNAEDSSVDRVYEIYAKGSGEISFECKAWYGGPLSQIDGAYYGSLQRTDANGGRGYDCGALNDRTAKGLIEAFVDPYFIETDVITPIDLSLEGDTLTTQQSLPPQKEIRGCGMQYPVFKFQKVTSGN